MDKLKKSIVNNLIDNLSSFYDCDLEFLKGYNFYVRSRGKVYMTQFDINSLDIERINSFGLYFGTFHDDERFRLSIEGSKFVKPKKNFVEIDENTLKSYLAGENLFKDEVKNISWEDRCPFLIVICGDENLGCTNIKDDMLLNYVSKGRKLDFNKVF